MLRAMPTQELQIATWCIQMGLMARHCDFTLSIFDPKKKSTKFLPFFNNNNNKKVI
jgi:hypothetical protein